MIMIMMRMLMMTMMLMIVMAMVEKLPLIGLSPSIQTSAMNLKPVSNISEWKRNWLYFKQKIKLK